MKAETRDPPAFPSRAVPCLAVPRRALPRLRGSAGCASSYAPGTIAPPRQPAAAAGSTTRRNRGHVAPPQPARHAVATSCPPCGAAGRGGHRCYYPRVMFYPGEGDAQRVVRCGRGRVWQCVAGRGRDRQSAAGICGHIPSPPTVPRARPGAAAQRARQRDRRRPQLSTPSPAWAGRLGVPGEGRGSIKGVRAASRPVPGRCPRRSLCPDRPDRIWGRGAASSRASRAPPGCLQGGGRPPRDVDGRLLGPRRGLGPWRVWGGAPRTQGTLS